MVIAEAPNDETATPELGNSVQEKRRKDMPAAPGPQIVGTWLCMAHRSDSTSPHDRPVILAFHADGNVTVSAATNINTPDDFPLDSFFFSRSNALGEWKKIGPNKFEYKSEALFYDKFGNAGGRQSVDAKLTHHHDTDQLKSDVDVIVEIRKYTIVGGKIMADPVIASPKARIVCNRLSVGFPPANV